MAITENNYTANGSNDTFNLTFEYLEQSHIKASIDGVDTTAFTLPTATTLKFNSVPTAGAAIRIFRRTDVDDKYAEFYPGSAIRSSDLNKNFDQTLFVTQELQNNALVIDGSNTMVGDLDMGGYRVINLGTPIAGTNAATKDYVDASTGSSEIPGHTRWRKVATAGQTVFSGTGNDGGTLSYSPVREQVYLNGALQQRNVDYSAADGTSITFNVALQLNDIVDVVCVNNLVSGTVSDAANITYSGQFAGQQPRTVASKLSDVVSVKDFGAVGDGVTNDTAAIQNAAAAGGALSFEQGKTYLLQGSVTFAANSVIYGNNATLLSAQNTPNNTSHFIVSAGCSLHDLEFRLATGAYAQRFVKLNGDCLLDGCRLSSADQIDDGDDNLDGALQIYNSNDTVIRNFKASSFDKPIFIENSTNVVIDGFEITDYTRGINIRTGTNLTITNGVFHTPSVNATTDPGHNAIGGEPTNIAISNVRITNTGEHGIYFANEAFATSYISGVSLSNVLVDGPGQCGVKLRGFSNVQLTGVTVVGCAYNNSLSTNEDCFRIEACSEVTISGCSGWRGPKVNCGYYGLYINGCNNVSVTGCTFEMPLAEGVKIEDANSESVAYIYIRDVVQRGGTYALGLNVVNGTVTDVVVDNYIVKTPSTGVFVYNAAGGEAGNRTLNFKLHGTAPATIETLTAGAPKWSVLDLESRKDYSSAKQELVGTAFTAGESNDGTLQISGLKGTAGAGNYTGAITFSAAGSSRRRAAIAGWQPTANGGQGGLCILTKSTTTTSSDALTPRIYIDHLGNVILNMNASVTPSDNGQLMLEATSDTSLTFKYKGSDGVVRSASLTLS